MQTFTQIVAIAALAQLVIAAPLSIQHNARDSTNNPLDGLDLINESTLEALGLDVEDGFKYLPGDVIASIEGSIPQKRQATNNPLDGLDLINEGTVNALLVALEDVFKYLPADIVASIKGSIPNFPQKRQATNNPLDGLDLINEGTVNALVVALEDAFKYLPADIVASIKGSIPNFPQRRQATKDPLDGLDLINESTLKALGLDLEDGIKYLPGDIAASIEGSIPQKE